MGGVRAHGGRRVAGGAHRHECDAHDDGLRACGRLRDRLRRLVRGEARSRGGLAFRHRIPEPPLALIPVLILWLGIDEAPKIAIVFLSSFFPIYLSALTAVKGIDPKLAEVAELLRFTSAERFRMLTLPAAMPGILAGLRMGFGYSWRALVGAELIAASSGLGFLITESSEFGKTDVVFVGIFTIVGLGIAADAVISRLVSALSRRISEAA